MTTPRSPAAGLLKLIGDGSVILAIVIALTVLGYLGITECDHQHAPSGTLWSNTP
jgi:hypothetical protein